MQVAIEDKERVLLDAIEALGTGWHDRQEIAAQINKKRLNPSEATVLELLVQQGKLEKELQPGELAHISHWVYRIKR